MKNSSAGPLLALLGCVLIVLPPRGQGRESRSFGRVLLLESTSETSASVSIGDVDADGTLDASPGAPYSLGVADLNRDGRPDIVVGRQDAVGSIFFNEGGRQPVFSKASWNDGKGSVYGVAIADLDGDGWPDIAAARSDAPNGIWFSGPARILISEKWSF